MLNIVRKTLKFLQFLYTRGYIQIIVGFIVTLYYDIFGKKGKPKYTRIKCPHCKQYVPLKNGRPYKKKK